MKIKTWLASIILVLILFTLGFITASVMNEATIQKNNNEANGSGLEVQLDKPKDRELLSINEEGAVGARTKLTGIDGEFTFQVDIELPTIGQNAVLDISELEYKILEDADQVKVHYIVDSETNQPAYVHFIRDEKGRLEIIDTKPFVVLDAGHGGFDLGDGTNDLWVEKDLTLKMTLKLKELLEEGGIRVVLTRSEDQYISLYDRCELSNYVGADLFISNHLNKMNGKVHGIEVFYSLKSDPVFAKDLANSISTVGVDVFKVSTRRDEQFSQLDYYFLHKYNDAESYIIEYGFSDHEGDAKIINENWTLMTERVAETIINYVFE